MKRSRSEDSRPKTVPGVAIAVAVDGAGEALRLRAMLLAGQLDLPIVDASRADEYAALLVITEGRLELRETGKNRSGPVYADFVGGRMGHRRKSIGSSERLLAKAVGLKRRPLGHSPRGCSGWHLSRSTADSEVGRYGQRPTALTVYDATAGLGRDAFVLACMGCAVTAIERSPVVAALLRDGLDRAAADPALAEIIGARLHLVMGDARRLLPKLPGVQRPDVVYLDPMFPPRRKSAAVKKEMRLCRLVAGDDADAGELLKIALAVARSRVVVKRPLRAPRLGDSPAIVFKGTTIRYDVYPPSAQLGSE